MAFISLFMEETVMLRVSQRIENNDVLLKIIRKKGLNYYGRIGSENTQNEGIYCVHSYIRICERHNSNLLRIPNL